MLYRSLYRSANPTMPPNSLAQNNNAELARADQYEVATYKRVAAKLASGKQAWVYYIDARFAH